MAGKRARIELAWDRVAILPGLLPWRKRRFDAAFEAGLAAGNCRGVYGSFAEAAAAAPPNWPVGFDNEGAAGMYRDRMNSLYPSDYPMMRWLGKTLEGGARRVFDLGGHIGLTYYAYQRNIAWPDDLSWTVHDVPAVMASGRAEALKRDPARRLTFSDGFEAAADADVLFTAGCVQFLEPTLAERVASLPRRPPWILVNLLPLHPARTYWTVQSTGPCFCPYRIEHTASFFADLERLGYRVEDRWENLDKSCRVAFEPAHSLDRYHGAALRLA